MLGMNFRLRMSHANDLLAVANAAATRQGENRKRQDRERGKQSAKPHKQNPFRKNRIMPKLRYILSHLYFFVNKNLNFLKIANCKFFYENFQRKSFYFVIEKNSDKKSRGKQILLSATFFILRIDYSK